MAYGTEDPDVKVKLAHAVDLIANTDLPLSTISARVGLGGEGITLTQKLLDKGLTTDEELSVRRKTLHKRNEGKIQ